MLAYILIHTSPARFNDVTNCIRCVTNVIKSDVVFGPTDLIAKIHIKDFVELCRTVTELLKLDNVLKTVTYPVIDVTEKEDLNKESQPCLAYVFMLVPKAGLSLLDEVRKIHTKKASVICAHMALGEYDFIAEVQSENLQDLKDLLQEIQLLGGVSSTMTLIKSTTQM